MMGKALRRGGYSVLQVAVAIVIIAGLVALTYLALHELGIAIPPFVIQALWIVFIVVVIVLCMIAIAKFWGKLGGPPNS